jgi:hypothetical protein
MNRDDKLRDALLDVDGSCRDITYDGASWDGIGKLLLHLRKHYSKMKGSRSPLGEDVTSALLADEMPSVLPKEPDTFCLLVAEDSSAMISHLQIFVAREKDDSPFIEMTFFPQDLRASDDLVQRFRDLADNWAQLLDASKYYVRYENASWKFGDCSFGSGVVFVGPSGA